MTGAEECTNTVLDFGILIIFWLFCLMCLENNKANKGVRELIGRKVYL